MIRRIALLAALAAVPAFAQDASPAFPSFAQDTSEPIAVEAETFVGQTRADVYTYRGNVVAAQGGLRLRADELEIHAPSGQARTMSAKGNVAFVSPSGTATGAAALYDVKTRRLTLSGGVVLAQGENVMRGAELDVALDTGVATLKGGVASAGRPGRVQGLFAPAQTPAAQPSTRP